MNLAYSACRCGNKPRSSRGPGHRVLSPATAVQIRYGVLSLTKRVHLATLKHCIFHEIKPRSLSRTVNCKSPVRGSLTGRGLI